MSLKRRFAVAALLVASVSVPAAAQRSQPFREATLYELLPADWPYPLIRVCSTDEGICLIPFTVPPGRPCECVRSDGFWIPGVCIR